MLSKEDQSRIIILSGPSGTGKSTIIKELLEKNKEKLQFSISTTTRAIRPDEIDGKDYYFVSIDTFIQQQEQGLFVESANVHGNYYGTSKNTIKETLDINNNMHCLLDIDVQGALSILNIYPYSKRIFLLPPSLKELQERLSKRGDTSKEDMKVRLRNARKELQYIMYYNFFVVNHKADFAVKEIESYIYGK